MRNYPPQPPFFCPRGTSNDFIFVTLRPKKNVYMNAVYTILLLLFSWMIAFAEYCCQVPANRLGFEGNGGPFNLMQLKVIQEVISLIVFTVIATVMFQGQALHWNHLAAFFCLVLAVYFVFL